MGTTKTVCVKNADWVVAWDASSRRHAYLEHGDVAFAGDTLTFVGRDHPGRADETIDGRGLMVMPGLIDVHSHPCLEASYRGIREEHGVPEMYMSGLFERAGAYWPDDEGKLACAEAAYCELLRSGVTTLVDISGDYPGWLELIARSGLRGVLAPCYASSRWVVRRSHLLEYEWNEAAGRQAFEEALRLCDDLAKHPSGRLSGMISPAQIDTCTEDLLRDSVAAARERGLPFTVHCAQAAGEFHEMVRRHGITPIQWAHQIGLTGPGHHLRPRHVHRRALVAALVVEEGHRDHGRHRHLGRPLPDAVRPLRPHARGLRQVSARRREPGHRHRHGAPEPARGDALGHRARADRRRGHPHRPRWPTSSTPPPWAAPARSCARTWAGSPPAPRPISCSSI